MRRYCATYGSLSSADTIVVWGDSHADPWAPAFYRLADQHGLRIVFFTHFACPPLLGVRQSQVQNNDCDDTSLGGRFLESIKALERFPELQNIGLVRLVPARRLSLDQPHGLRAAG